MVRSESPSKGECWAHTRSSRCARGRMMCAHDEIVCAISNIEIVERRGDLCNEKSRPECDHDNL